MKVMPIAQKKATFHSFAIIKIYIQYVMVKSAKVKPKTIEEGRAASKSPH
jgi:hypothetical protein